MAVTTTTETTTPVIRPRFTNAIQVAFAGCLKQAISDMFGVSDSLCPVLYTGQPIPSTARRCVTYSKISDVRVGFQGRKLVTDDSEDTGFYDIANWVDEITFQVNARSKESAEDSVTTPVARDIIEGIVTWINNEMGLEYMRTQKVYPLRVSNVRDLMSADESDRLQSVVSCDVTVQIGQAKLMREIESQKPQLETIYEVGRVPRTNN